MTVHLETTPDGVLLPVRAKPKASRNGLAGVHDGRLRVAVTAAPEKGNANAAVLQLLVAALDLKRSQLSLVAGEANPQKTVLVTGIPADELRQRIAAALE